MNLYTTLQRGQQHKHFCEDFLLHTSMGEEWQIAVVADGCSGGKDSHFASTLACKLIRKIANKQPFSFNKLAAKEVGLKVLQQFFTELKQAQKQLQLDTDELLSTLLFMVFNKTQAWVTVLGDGVVMINGDIHIIDQNNIPDYPAYHLNDKKDALQNYLTKTSFEVKNPQQSAIATDGILSFVSPKIPHDKSKEDIISYFLLDSKFAQHPNMLNRKCNILRTQNHLVNMDDLAIVRATINNTENF